MVQRSFVCAFESALGRVEQRESEFMEASTVCATYAEIVKVTDHNDLSVCIVAAPHGFFEVDCPEACRSIKADIVLCHARLLVQAPYRGAQRR